MALTPEKKAQIFADLLFKDVLAGKATSSELTAFFEELIDSQRLILPSQIAADEALIPHTAQDVPGIIEEIVDLPMKEIPGADSRAFYHSDLKGIVPFNFGDGSSYLYQLKKQDNSPIPFGQNDWFFNPHAGVLYFMDGFPAGVSLSQPPKISCFKYVGARGLIPSSGNLGEYYDSVLSIETDPTTLNPNSGDQYLIGNGAIDIWANRDGQVARMVNVNYSYTIPTDGATVKVDNEDGEIYHHEGVYQTAVFNWINYTLSTVRVANATGKNTYSANIVPPLNGHSSDVLIIGLFAMDNDAPVTFDPNLLGPMPVRKNDGTGNLVELEAGDIKAGVFSFLWFDGFQYQFFSLSDRLPVNRTIYVDSTYGDDISGRPYDEYTPYKSGSAAESIAKSGDVIRFRPGVYVDTGLGKDGITYYYEAGAFSQNLDDSANSTFTDVDKGAIQFKVCGYGYFILERHWNINNFDVEIVRLSDASQVDFEAYKCENVGDDGGIFKALAVNGEIRAKVDEIYSGSVIAYTKGGGFISIRSRKASLSREFQAADQGEIHLYIDNVYTDVRHAFSTYHHTFHTKNSGHIRFEGIAHYDPDNPNGFTALCTSQFDGTDAKSIISVKGILNIISHKWFGFAGATNSRNNIMYFEGEVNIGADAKDDLSYVESNGRIVARNLVVKSESTTRTTGIIPADSIEFHAESTTFVLSAPEVIAGSKAIYASNASNSFLKSFFSNAPVDVLVTNLIPLGLVDVGNPNIKE